MRLSSDAERVIMTDREAERSETAMKMISWNVNGLRAVMQKGFMEAFADAAVKYGLPRATAYKLISQTVLGSAKLQQVTGEHPGVLKDAVCSPNGTTICGVAALEKAGFRSACIECIDAIVNKRKG